jgi:hypothetical protein
MMPFTYACSNCYHPMEQRNAVLRLHQVNSLTMIGFMISTCIISMKLQKSIHKSTRKVTFASVPEIQNKCDKNECSHNLVNESQSIRP